MSRHNDGMHCATAAARDDDAVSSTDSHQKAFEFVQALAAELSRGRVELPAYPEVAMRVREVLADPDVTNDRIARVIASDGGLAARILGLTNSAALARGGKGLTDLKLAVTRIGHDNVRSAALAYALAQIRAADSLRHIRDDLAALWERSTLVAALARTLALHARAAGPDEAMLAGLLHNVGSVYILARSARQAEFLGNAAVRHAIVQDWQAQIGKAIAQNWGVPEHVVEAIGEQDTFERLEATRRDLVDVLFVAVRAADFHGRTDQLEHALDGLAGFHRLALDGASLRAVMEQSADEIASLRAALGQ